MAKKIILGTDIARDAFKVKVNDNFTELYNKDVALGTQINDLEANKADKTELLNYEIGIFTPAYECSTGSFATLTYSAQLGRYTRIGRLVYFDLNIATSNVVLGTASGNLLISGLPFVQGVVYGAGAYATALKFFNLSVDDIVRFLVAANKISIYLDKPNGAMVSATPSSLKTGANVYSNDLRLSGFYTL